MSYHRKRVMIIISLLWLSGMLLCPSPILNAAEKTFKFSEDGAPTTMDPVRGATTYANTIITALYDTLYEYKYLKRPYELQPNLATSMPTVSKDGLTYTIKIKPGVHFTDDPCFTKGKGREVIAADFVYSLKRHFDPQMLSEGDWLWKDRIVGLDAWKTAGADYNKAVEGLKALDKHTIQIKLVKPYPQLVYTLAMGFSAIVPKEAVDKYGKEFAVHPVGSGPWKLQSFNTKKTVIIKNKKYREEIFVLKDHGFDPKVHGALGFEKIDGKRLPIMDRIELNWMKEPVTRWSSFVKGNEVQNAVLPSEQLDAYIATKNPATLKKEHLQKFHLSALTESGFVFLNFNMADETIGYNPDPKRNSMNKELRCAIRKAFNWPQRINRFYLGIGSAFPGVIPPGTDGYNPDLSRDSVTRDLKGGKAMLKKAGWNKNNLPDLEYHGVSSVRNKQFYEQFRGWMVELGYPRRKVKLKTYATFGDFNKAVRQQQAMLIPMGWGLDYPDSENTLQLYYGPNEAPGSNSANYKNPEFDKLFAKTSTMQPSVERTKIYQQLNQMIIDDCVVISGFARTRLRMWHKNVIAYPDRNMIGNWLKYAATK